MRVQRFWIAGLAGALLLSGCSILPQEAELPPIDVPALQVTQREVAPVKRGKVEERTTLTVSFGAERQTALYFRSGGRLRKLHAAPGQAVKAGALLAELESGSIPYDMASAEIDVEKAKLALEKAKGRIGFTDAPWEADLKKLELELQQAQLRRQRQQDLLADSRIYAPFDGTVLQVGAAEGDTVEGYKDVLLLAADGGAVARATVDDATAAKLQAGMLADIFPADGNDSPVRGKVLSVPVVGSGARDRTVVVAPLEPSHRLRPGRNGKVEVVLQAKENVLLVPNSAIRTFGGRKFVTVVQGETRQEVAITTGVEGAQYTEVVDGLQEGDQVVSR